ncbi:YrhK family protein [Patulibacter sp.]|uniref:YrhK family protein n=1 Tax=Patulibacter sp. TaxID=1912859 RepID=UPI00272834BA|nr:YrhK family protein [Patulibacter sp.]MDO9408297.1 YrhK family protein [Patulibacter sp.]
MKLLHPSLADLTPRHVELFWRYQVVRTGVDFSAAMCFLVGSAFFFFASLSRPADWLFLVGSILFAVKPTIDLVRSAHLRRLPTTASPAAGDPR